MNPLAAAPRREYILSQKERSGRRVLGVFPGRYPREVLWALNILPVEIWDPPLEPERAAGHLQTYICPIARQGLELVLSGMCDGLLDGLLFPHTCDSLQNLGSLCRDCLELPFPCYFFHPPKGSPGAGAGRFHRAALEALLGDMEEGFGRPRPVDLEQALIMGEGLRELLVRLHEMRSRGGIAASNSEIYRVLRKIEYLHPEDSIPGLRGFLEEREAAPCRARPGPSVVLSGIVPPPGLLSILDDQGIAVADDDLLACARRIPAGAGAGADPLERITRLYMDMPPCPTGGGSIGERAAYLQGKVRQCGASGVIFCRINFCEPELFHLPALEEALKASGIRSLTLEAEPSKETGGRSATRLEAFAEILRGRRAEEDRPGIEEGRGPGGEERPFLEFGGSFHRKLKYFFMRDAGAPMLMRMQRAFRRRPGSTPRPRGAGLGPPLKSTALLRKIMTRHYYLARHAKWAMPVAWVTSGAPVELLRAAGFYTVYPENHGALCGARGMGADLCRAAEDTGYSQDLCSYARIDLGSVFSGKTPVGRLPRPDLLFASNNICQTVAYWYRILARHWGVPLVVFDTPFNYGNEPRPQDMDYMTSQLESMIPLLEGVAGRDLHMDRLRDAVRLSRLTAETWGKVLSTLEAKPAPMTIFDAFMHLAPVVSLRGLPVALRYYDSLLEELRDRVRRGVGGITDERKRLMWDNIAVWYKVRDFSRFFAERGMGFVTATYTNAWAETAGYMDEENPLRSLAHAYTKVILNRDLGYRLELMSELIRRYRVDGLVMHSARSCKPYSVGQYDIRRMLPERTGVPAVIIEADIADQRAYSEEQTMTRLEAFLEGLGA